MVAYAWRKVRANARSWRSECSRCGARGAAGVARLAVTKPVFNGRRTLNRTFTKLTCLSCVTPNQMRCIIEIAGGPEQVSGFHSLAAEDRAFMRAKELSTRRSSAKAKAKAAVRVPTGPRLNDTVQVAAKLEKFFTGSYKEKEKVPAICAKMGRVGMHAIESPSSLFIVGPVPPDMLDAMVFSKLAHTASIRSLRILTVSLEVFDFSGLSGLIQSYLPNLKTVSIHPAKEPFSCDAYRVPLVNFCLEDIPSVKTVDLNECDFRDGVLKLHLRGLKSFRMSTSNPSVQNLHDSMLHCPGITCFSVHTFLTPDGVPVEMPPLYLPSCSTFSFSHTSTVSKLSLFLPRVRSVSLESVENMTSVDFLKDGRKEIEDFLLGDGEKESHFTYEVWSDRKRYNSVLWDVMQRTPRARDHKSWD